MPQNSNMPLTNAQRKVVHEQRVPFGLSLYEIEVIKAMREIKFGQITFHFHDGIPLRFTVGSSHSIDPTNSTQEINAGK